MYFEDYDNNSAHEKGGDDVFSKPIRAGKRTYFFDVKATKGNDYYLTITESKRRVERDGSYAYDKHKIFLYKEDFDKFTDGLEEVIRFIRERCPFAETPTRSESVKIEKKYDEGFDKSFSDVDFDEL